MSPMSATVYIPRDSSALSMGAGAVADAISAEAKRRNADVRIVRNGSRGLYWLEPLVEVETPKGRVAYGPVSASDVASLFDANFLAGENHRLALGITEDIPYLKSQERLTFARVGITDPVSLDDYVAHGGYRGLQRALAMTGAQVVEEVTVSGLRGRGGAGFPAGIKWKTTLGLEAKQKYVVCNADEGDSGTFSDRMIMEGDPFVLIEGMTMLEVRVGAGAYICGEETAMLESLEGKRGMVRYKPPVPAIVGLFGMPTIINNVITLASVPIVVEKGGNFYKDYGMGRSRGTLPIQLAGNAKRPGLIEKAFGVTLREIIYEYGGGTASGRPVRAVQVGGPLGAYFPDSMLDLPMDYEAIAAKGGLVGHGGIVVFDDTVDLAQMARYAMEFCAIESCGKCTPCRIGSTRGVDVIDRIIRNEDRAANAELLRDLCDTMQSGSLCALGGLTPLPVRSALTHFPGDFGLATS